MNSFPTAGQIGRGDSVPSSSAGSQSPTFKLIVQTLTSSGITQAQLAEAVGASTRTIQNWASGQAAPKGGKIRRLLDLRYLVELLQTAYTDEGVQIWLHSRNRNLGAERPIDLILADRLDEVVEEAERLAGAM
jgi:transcriptional regulator with XRE-family HTH domain